MSIRAKPNSDRRRVIIDLSWPLGASVNAGIDKMSYLTSAFALTFPTGDDITTELTHLGHGALLYKVDISRAFLHVKVDPGDYDLLGLQWQGFYVDTCIPFGMQHGSKIFQRLSDGVRYMMHDSPLSITLTITSASPVSRGHHIRHYCSLWPRWASLLVRKSW